MPDNQQASHYLNPALFEAMQTFIAVLEVDGTVSFANPKPLKAAGIGLEEVRGKKFWDCPWFTHDPGARELIHSATVCAAAGENISDEVQTTTVHGLMWTSFTMRPVFHSGQVIQLIAEGYDITEKHRLAEEARRTQQGLQNLFDDMQTMVTLLDLEGRVTLVNNTPLLIAGLKSEDVIGLHLWACPWFSNVQSSQELIKKDIALALRGTPTLGDVQMLTDEGRIWVEFSVHPVCDADGKIIQLMAEGHDPSVRRQVEEEREQALQDLQDREQKLAVTLDSIGDAVITTDAGGRITRMNAIAERLTGWSFNEAQHQPLGTIFPIFNASTGQRLPSPVEKLMRSGEIVHLSNHTTLRARDGREYQIADSAAPIRDSEGSILGAILVFSDVSEQYRLRERAKATQERLQSLFDGMQTMVGILDIHGTVTFINNTPLMITGITRQEVIGHKLWEAPWLVEKEHSAATVKRLIKLANTGKSSSSDIQIDTLRGEMWVAFGTHPVIDDNGQIIEILAEARDITNRKAIEMELRISEGLLRRYRDQAPLATIEWTTDHLIVDVNDAAEKLFGYTLAELKGQAFTKLLPSDTPFDTQVIWKNLVGKTGGDSLISKVINKRGKLIYTRWHNAPLFDKEGKLSGAASIVLDLTNERAAQKALLDSEKTLRNTLDSMVEGIVVTDQYGVIHSVNQAAKKMTGYGSSELIGHPVNLLIQGQSADDFKQNMQRYLETGKLRYIGMGLEVDITCKNNDTFPTVLAVAELSQKGDSHRRFISSFRDLSELKQQEKQLRRSQKMDALGKLTGGIAHDFNNMLGIVTGYADLLEGALASEEKLAGFAHEIHRAGDRGAKLTRKLLAFSQQTAVSSSSLNINTLIHNQQHMLATSLTPRINMVYELGRDIWPIYLDGDDLEDAIINICINAMHAIEGNGQVTIRTENISLRSVNARLKNLRSGDYVQLCIIDNGKGMDEATREQIFDPFYTTKGENGTGLGLSQVYGFVERSRGGIDVTSVPGRGTQFRLYFPREISNSDLQQLPAKTAEKKLGGHETILLVDDEKKLLELCSEILSQQGYKVLPACNCSEALQLLEGNKVDLMFSDVVMPDMNGYELASIVAVKFPDIKIQMTSGFSDNRQSSASDASLHKNLLPKPYRAQALLGRIRALLDS
ncbi:hypothetical protein A9Q90_02705 [Gammaproteobacteria bacterium 54_18_T64]|nr:hypothetical protein A9Q90_02705 [Gammaproteobacteria bacterium 54_18_T64]